MASDPATAYAPLLIAIGVLFALGVVALVIVRWLTHKSGRGLNPILVLAVAVAHLVAYTFTFAIAFAMGDSQAAAPWPLVSLLAVLSAPLMYLMYLPPEFFGDHWWGDDWNFILGLAVLNALVWGRSIGWLVNRLRRRHAA